MEKLFNIPVGLFQLDKIMINQQKVCRVNFTILDYRGDKTDTYVGQIEPNYQCTDEVQQTMDELKPYLCNICHIDKNDQAKVNVTGVEVNGSEGTATFKIHGVQLSESDQSMRFATCKVQYAGGFYGFEPEVTEIIDRLQDLAHRYLFETEKAQLTLGLTDATIMDEEENDDDQTDD